MHSDIRNREAIEGRVKREMLDRDCVVPREYSLRLKLFDCATHLFPAAPDGIDGLKMERVSRWIG